MNFGEALPTVSDEDLALTPTSVKRLIVAMALRVTALEERVSALESENARLLAENAELRAENAVFRADNVALRTENAALRERLNLYSHNSSKPPSSDGPAVPPAPPKPKSKKNRGAQKCVVQLVGMDPSFSYETVARALTALSHGALFVACNLDANYPGPGGGFCRGAGRWSGRSRVRPTDPWTW